MADNIFKDTDIRKITIHHTPVGIASAVFITDPSTEYDDDGQYFIRLKFKTASKECKKLVAIIDEARQAAFDAAMELLEKPVDKKNLKLADPSYKLEEDDDGNETGYTVFNFKRKAIRTNKKGEVRPVTLPLYDSVLQPITERENLEVWSGSEIAVAFRLMPFYTARLGVGVSHRIEAVQILKAVAGDGNRNAEDFGFQRQSGGFVGGEAEEEEDDLPGPPTPDDEESEDEKPVKRRRSAKSANDDNGDY